tara:strand:- start:740 stop:1342 length:603 start_codon:yes stop_codon:yes gene_type:complete
MIRKVKIEFLKDYQNNILSGPIIISPEIFIDSRGYFFESWNEKKFNAALKSKNSFVQDNQSFSKKGTLRGLHYQLEPLSQGKLIRVIRGEIYDVIVDLRHKSNSFSKWAGINLSSTNKNQLWIPEGFAHGFLTLANETIVEYKVTNYWDSELERTILWNDRHLNIKWPELKGFNNKFFISKKDLNGNRFKDLLEKGELFK